MIFLGGLVVDLDRGFRNPHVKYLAKSYPSWPVLTPEQRFAGRGEVFATDV